MISRKMMTKILSGNFSNGKKGFKKDFPALPPLKLFLVYIINCTVYLVQFRISSSEFFKKLKCANRMITYTNPYKHNFQFCESYVAARSRWLILQLFQRRWIVRFVMTGDGWEALFCVLKPIDTITCPVSHVCTFRLQIRRKRTSLQTWLSFQPGRGTWQRNGNSELQSMEYKRPTKKTNPRQLLRCLSGKRNSPREENAEICRQV